MGLFSSLFGGSSSSATATASTTVNVEVNPQIGIDIENEVDLTPIAEVVERLAVATQEQAVAFTEGLTRLTEAGLEAVESEGDKIRDLAFVAGAAFLLTRIAK